MIRYLVCDKGYRPIDKWQPGCWIDVETPDSDDMRILSERFRVPQSFLDYISDDDERPRLEREGEWTMTIIRVPMRSNDRKAPFSTAPFGIINRGDVVVTLCFHHTEMIDDFIDYSIRRCLLESPFPDFILHILHASAFRFLKYLRIINNDVISAESQLEKSVRNEDLLDLMKMQKTLVYFDTSVQGNETLIERLHRAYDGSIDLDLLEDVDIELKQAKNTVTIYSDILGGTLDTFASVISNNVNGIMKRMTCISIILMVPTLIASFYGMNVDILVSDNPHAFWYILFGSTVLTAVCTLWLKRLKWF